MAKTEKSKSRDELIQEVAELKAEIKYLRHDRNIFSVVSIFKNLIRYGALLGIFYFIYLSIDSLAGKQTFANIGVNVLANIKLSEAVAWIFAGSSFLYGLNERRLRRKAIEHFKPRIIQLEQLIDSTRTSSLLTGLGDTNPEDDV